VAEPLDGGAKIGLGVYQDGGFDEDRAIVVAEKILGPGLGAIDADDAKMLRPDRLHALGELPVRLLDKETSRLFGPT
jgi:hypothetical protein